MNNQIKIIQENGKYVGYLLKHGEVIFTTAPCDDAGTASKLVSEHVHLQATQVPTPTAQVAPTASQQNPSQPVVNQTTPARAGGCGCKRG